MKLAILKRPEIGEAENAERAIDERDLAILSDLVEGYSLRETAENWNVPYNYIRRLWLAREASHV